jgi:hypothetical protein
MEQKRRGQTSLAFATIVQWLGATHGDFARRVADALDASDLAAVGAGSVDAQAAAQAAAAAAAAVAAINAAVQVRFEPWSDLPPEMQTVIIEQLVRSVQTDPLAVEGMYGLLLASRGTHVSLAHVVERLRLQATDLDVTFPVHYRSDGVFMGEVDGHITLKLPNFDALLFIQEIRLGIAKDARLVVAHALLTRKTRPEREAWLSTGLFENGGPGQLLVQLLAQEALATGRMRAFAALWEMMTGLHYELVSEMWWFWQSLADLEEQVAFAQVVVRQGNYTDAFLTANSDSLLPIDEDDGVSYHLPLPFEHAVADPGSVVARYMGLALVLQRPLHTVFPITFLDSVETWQRLRPAFYTQESAAAAAREWLNTFVFKHPYFDRISRALHPMHAHWDAHPGKALQLMETALVPLILRADDDDDNGGVPEDYWFSVWSHYVPRALFMKTAMGDYKMLWHVTTALSSRDGRQRRNRQLWLCALAFTARARLWMQPREFATLDGYVAVFRGPVDALEGVDMRDLLLACTATLLEFLFDFELWRITASLPPLATLEAALENPKTRAGWLVANADRYYLWCQLVTSDARAPRVDALLCEFVAQYAGTAATHNRLDADSDDERGAYTLLFCCLAGLVQLGDRLVNVYHVPRLPRRLCRALRTLLAEIPAPELVPKLLARYDKCVAVFAQKEDEAM